MERTQKTEIVNMCMIYKDGLVLVQDKIHDEWGGITFPGGHVEKDESFTDAVIREVFEETGLTITSPKLCGTKDWVNDDGSRYMVLFYKTDKFSGEIRSSVEGEVFWIPLEEMLLLENRLSLDMKDMVKVFVEDSLSEFFYYKENGEWKYCLKQKSPHLRAFLFRNYLSLFPSEKALPTASPRTIYLWFAAS